MAEEIIVPVEASKSEKYRMLKPQIDALLEGEVNLIANMANTVAALKQAFGFFWVGFYIVENEELVLGPYQGPVACTRIKKGKGVCGSSWAQGEVIIVPDVDQFPGHIACNSASRSEIVLPFLNQKKEIIAVLDVDSDRLNDFDSVDEEGLSIILKSLSATLAH